MMVGPDYVEPKKNISDHWIKKSSKIKETSIHDAAWWTTFKDPTLTNLIVRSYQNNLSLQVAGVRVLQTRAALAQSTGELYPQQQALVGNYTYNKIGGGMLKGLVPESFDTASLGFSLNWELDFWGKYRRAILSNNAAFLASYAAYDSALVTLTADVASSYISIRTNEELIKVTQKNIAIQKESLDIAEARYRAGETSLLDVEQAKTQLSETESKLPGYLSSLQTEKDKLAVLLGTTPKDVDALLTKSHGIPKAPATVAVGIPCETLTQRPDIHQARFEAITQLENIGAIKANLFPSLTLGGTFSYASNSIGQSSVSDIFQASNKTITVGPGLTWPLLNYGQITNAVREQDAAFQQALLKYLNLVLQAQQEVQDNISRYVESQKAEHSLTKANISAIQSTKLALIRYKEGESNYTTVIDVERQQLQVETGLTNAKGDVSQTLVALYRSLGGGWQIRDGNDIVPKEVKAEMAARTNWGQLLEQKNHEPPNSTWEKIKQLFLPTW
jgi:NodT family efflux transporter outer membrane factor (OMF) lipoprotein